VNTIVLWNTLYMNKTVEHLKTTSMEVVTKTLGGYHHWASSIYTFWDDTILLLGEDPSPVD